MNAVYENKNYKVVLDPHTEDGQEVNWSIINKRYDIVECRLSILPSAIFTADNLSKAYDEAFTPTDTPSNVTVLQ